MVKKKAIQKTTKASLDKIARTAKIETLELLLQSCLAHKSSRNEIEGLFSIVDRDLNDYRLR